MLVIDDLALQPLSAHEAADLLEVIEDRSGRRSTIVTSQLPVAHWHESLGDATLADAILDRLVHNAHRIELHGDSLRRPQEPAAVSVDVAPSAPHDADQATRRGRAEKRAATTAQDARK